MITAEHQQHIVLHVSHNNCDECRADCERQHLREQWPGYRHISEYLNWIKPRLTAIRNGHNSIDGWQWKREFTRALHRRISLKGSAETGRKHCSGYLSRLRQFRSPDGKWSADGFYLRRFAARGASTLH